MLVFDFFSFVKFPAKKAGGTNREKTCAAAERLSGDYGPSEPVVERAAPLAFTSVFAGDTVVAVRV
jgi:hypothetical protein